MHYCDGFMVCSVRLNGHMLGTAMVNVEQRLLYLCPPESGAGADSVLTEEATTMLVDDEGRLQCDPCNC